MPKDVFNTGEIVRARVTYRDPDTSALLDPGTVSVAVRSPDATIASYVYGTDPEVTRVSLGVYQVSVSLAQTGTYKWKWTGTGTEKAAVDYDECESLLDVEGF
jgi:hypothetical protein